MTMTIRNLIKPTLRAPLIAATLLLAIVSTPALAIKPFSANYLATYMGFQGQGKMTLEPQGTNKWKYSLNIGSSGLQLNQSTVFEDKDGTWRPLSGADSSLLLIKKTDKRADYNWDQGMATWSGDVKSDRAGPVALKAGDVDALLLNLVLARDIQAGKPLSYRMVDDGRVKDLTYKVAGKETIKVAGESKEATKAVNVDGSRQITVWVVDGLPVPARILQQKNGKDDIDLTIQSVN